MKNVVAMARAGTLPRGSKLNIYFASDEYAGMAPAIPEALAMYLKMMEGLELEWAVGYIGDRSVMDTPLARLALQRGGSFRVGLETDPSDPPIQSGGQSSVPRGNFAVGNFAVEMTSARSSSWGRRKPCPWRSRHCTLLHWH